MDIIHTFQRLDAKPIYPESVFGDNAENESETFREEYLNSIPAFDAMESVYEIKPDNTLELLRDRTIRLGLPDPCDNRCENGVIMADNKYVDNCNLCGETGIKLRNVSPAWTEAASTEPPRV